MLTDNVCLYQLVGLVTVEVVSTGVSHVFDNGTVKESLYHACTLVYLNSPPVSSGAWDEATVTPYGTVVATRAFHQRTHNSCTTLTTCSTQYCTVAKYQELLYSL